ncbi:MAG TPA: hypothetical protein VHV32_00665 [Candidatus Angelobacter sp.]|jgi:hypothetical protein|nr:hypothetical protein [Candidatus Angelobacter sp.]
MFSKDIEQAGLVGENLNAQVIFLAMVSARTLQPLNVTVQGASSGGKNYLIEMVRRFMPPEMIKNLTGMTPKVLMHSRPDEYKHKAVIIAEHEGAAAADYPIRVMQSEGFIEWEYVDSGSPGGIKKKSNKVHGPAAFIEATTRTMLHPENETRLLFAHIDESAEQTRRVIDLQSRCAAGLQDNTASNITHSEWQEFIRTLRDSKIVVPYASKVGAAFPAQEVRSRRDFPKLLGLLMVSAFLHQQCRDRDSSGAIVASTLDYEYVLPLFRASYDSGPNAELRKLLIVAKEFPPQFKVEQLVKVLQWGQTKTYEILGRAVERGFITKDERGKYTFVSELPSSKMELPERIG